jgi:hypothetical protein
MIQLALLSVVMAFVGWAVTGFGWLGLVYVPLSGSATMAALSLGLSAWRSRNERA